MPTAKITDGDIFFRRQGYGVPTVLLLPQSTGPVGVGPFVEALAESFDVIRYDQRGTGRSPPPFPVDAITMADRAKELGALLDALDINRAHLICHSTGCGIGLAFAAASPNRVDRLALAAPWSHGDRYLTTMQNLRVAAARALEPADYACYNASLLFPPGYRRKHAEEFDRLAAEAASHDANQIAARLGAILDFDARPLAATMARPALIVTAEDDQLMPPWFGRELAKSMPAGRFIELAGGGHMIPETRSIELADMLTDFFNASLA